MVEDRVHYERSVEVLKPARPAFNFGFQLITAFFFACRGIESGRGDCPTMLMRLQSRSCPTDEQPHQDTARTGRQAGGGGQRANNERARSKSEARRRIHQESARPA